jgi:hypothetical protein
MENQLNGSKELMIRAFSAYILNVKEAVGTDFLK